MFISKRAVFCSGAMAELRREWAREGRRLGGGGVDFSGKSIEATSSFVGDILELGGGGGGWGRRWGGGRE